MTGVQTCALPICFPVTIGGGAGSTTGAPMGATGATGAGSAADPNAQLQALMSLRQVRMSERKNEAEINLLKQVKTKRKPKR